MRPRAAWVSMWLCLMGHQVHGVELRHKVEAGAKISLKTKSSSTFSAIGNVPGYDLLEGTSKTVGEVEWTFGEKGEDGGRGLDVKGRLESAVTINESPWNRQVWDIGPMEMVLSGQGAVEDVKLPAYEPTLRNLMRFNWVNHISQQLVWPGDLPEGDVSIGSTWTGQAKLRDLSGNVLDVLTTSQLIGQHTESDKQGWYWIQSTAEVPVKSEFEVPGGTYRIRGNIRFHSLTLFDIVRGFWPEQTTYSTMSLDVGMTLKEGAELARRGLGFNVHMVVQSKDVIKASLSQERLSR